jgi:hypothetical protein
LVQPKLPLLLSNGVEVRAPDGAGGDGVLCVAKQLPPGGWLLRRSGRPA